MLCVKVIFSLQLTFFFFFFLSEVPENYPVQFILSLEMSFGFTYVWAVFLSRSAS